MPSTATPALPLQENTDSEPRKPLTPAAERALAEAAERRAARDAEAALAKKTAELGGQPGPDPVRYGDWEKAGIVSDF
jgi:hypothetical protein